VGTRILPATAGVGRMVKPVRSFGGQGECGAGHQ
jgi:hypothetical protein